jgi:hypothetical protein
MKYNEGETMAENNEYILKHPHDSFFKKSFSKPEIAKDFLKNYFPEKVLKHIDLNTLMKFLIWDWFIY